MPKLCRRSLWRFRRFLVLGVLIAVSPTALAEIPATLYWQGEHLARLRAGGEAQPAAIRAALSQLETNAKLALERGPYSVVDKEIVPPSGDKHDYLSFSRYWWPNPETPDGLPYIRRDGEVNRKLLRRGDRVRIGHFFDDVETLTLAAYLLDNETDKYASHATKLIRTWFLDPQTRMNPNVNFGQGVPGKATGRGVGIIDTRHFIRVLDAVVLLRELDALSEQEVTELKGWFTEYLEWLTTSELAQHEQQAKNNHGSWYAAQAARVALFVDDQQRARSIVEGVRDQRIPQCFQADGSQPLELERTRSLHYSLFNLYALAIVDRMGEQLGIDLWNHTQQERCSLKQGLDFVVPYVQEPAKWPHPEMGKFELSDRDRQLFLLAHLGTDDRQYLDLFHGTGLREGDNNYSVLVFPTEAETN